jgi:predicted SAM-dependent methyltransferase
MNKVRHGTVEQPKLITSLRNTLDKVGLLDAARRIARPVRQLARRNHDARLIESYLAYTNPAKLHIGCGAHFLPGWLNTDYEPTRSDMLLLDATRQFGFKDNSFDFVFSEHMIEHISFSAGSFMLRECCRILRPEGRIRISTPDLAFVLNLYASEKSDLQKRYIQWFTTRFGVPEASEAFVINQFFRFWGHQFIYDEKTLSAALSQAGFIKIVKCNLQESESEALCNLENETRMPKGFLRLETLTIEAMKPLAS